MTKISAQKIKEELFEYQKQKYLKENSVYVSIQNGKYNRSSSK